MPTKSVQPVDRVTLPWWVLMRNNFLGGISWGVGSVIGATVVIGVIGFVIAQTRSLPLIGHLVEVTMDEIEKYQDRTRENFSSSSPSPSPSSQVSRE
jgi:hypothetical protein